MTSHLDSGARSGGHAEAEQPNHVCTEGSRLLQQAEDRDTAHRLARRLTGHGLPEVELRTLQAALVPLRSHVQGWVAVEFFPGEGARTAIEPEAAERMAVMRAHVEHPESFRELAAADARALSVISERPTTIDLTSAFIDPRGLALCDPELLVAVALGLPTAQVGGVQRYRRLTLLAKDARIEKVIFPPEENVDGHLQRVVTWIRATRR